MGTKLNYSFGSISQLGKKQTYNTDAIIEFAINNGHVFVVCDGHNGDEGHGALAAKLTADSIKKYFHNRTYKDLANALTNAVTYANYVVFEQAQKEAKFNGIGATLAIVIHYNNSLYYAYAGDSRIYLHKDNVLKALTLDHVEDRFNPTDSALTVLVGRDKDIKFGVCKNPIELVENDKVLICTDGLTDVVNTEDLAEILADHDTSPEHKALLMVKKAEDNNGADNASVHIVEFDNNIPVPTKKTMNKNVQTILVAIVIAFVVAFAGIKGYEHLVNQDESENVDSDDFTQEVKKEKSAEPKVEVEAEVAKLAETKNQESKKEVPVTKKPPVKEAINTTNNQVYYAHKIQFGENLYRLAIRYKVTQQQIIDINGDKAKKLIAGSELKIPVKAIHVVKSGESYSVISDKYNIKIDEICEVNKIDRNNPLSEGTKLIIPLKK